MKILKTMSTLIISSILGVSFIFAIPHIPGSKFLFALENPRRLDKKAHMFSDVVYATIYHEASGEPGIGQVAVLKLISRRADLHGMTWEEVCLKKGWFSCWDNNAKLKATEEFKKQFDKNYCNLYNPENDLHKRIFKYATHYHNPKLSSPDYYRNPPYAYPKSYDPDRGIWLGEIGNHVFYCFTKELPL